MKILFLSSVLPHSRVVSGSIIIHHRIRMLAERDHQVGLACFADADERLHTPDLQPFLIECETLDPPAPRTPGKRILDYAITPVPSAFRAMRSQEMRHTVGRMIERTHYDVVIAEFSVMGQYLHRNTYLPAVRRIVSCHSCHTRAHRNDVILNPLSPQTVVRSIRAKGLAAYEFAMYRSADHVLTLTNAERISLLESAPELHVSVVPYGVDINHFQPSNNKREKIVMFSGYFHDEPNADAAIWFMRTVWPELSHRFPEFNLYFVGRAPTPAMLDAARRDHRIVVTGEVEDMTPYLRRASAFVCPMRMGTGFRGKILQAMACGVPVVSTSLGAQGFRARTGDNILLADTPRTMLHSLELLLSDPQLRQNISRSAREIVQSRYSWNYCVDRLEDVLNEVVTVQK